MNVVAIVPDRNITVDKKMLTLSDDAWTFDDSHIHAIHWDGTSGELEFVDTSQNIDLTTVDMVQPYIDKFFSELPKIEKLHGREKNKNVMQRTPVLLKCRNNRKSKKIFLEKLERLLKKIEDYKMARITKQKNLL